MQTDIKVTIEATDGRPMRHYAHEGKTYVEAHDNRDYQVRVKNQTGHRIKAVIAVDSLNIVNGEPATDKPEETGYILNPYEEQVFKGFRVDGETVAAFRFAKREKSYATEKGSGTGNGVIAVRAWREKESDADRKVKEMLERIHELEKRRHDPIIIDRPYPVYPWRRPYWTYPYYGDSTWTTCEGSAVAYGSADNGTGNILRGMGMSTTQCSVTPTMMNCSIGDVAAQSAVDASPFDAGTSWGDSVKAAVREVAFEAGELIAEIAVYYAFKQGLEALGIDVTRQQAVAFPEPFKKQWCAAPSGWKR